MSNHCHHHNYIEELKSDHEKILEHLIDLETTINQPTIALIKIKEFLRFTEIFAEPHYQKEEQILFPALEKKGMSNENGPIGMMLLEHIAERDYLTKIREAIKENDEDKLKENTQAMISLLKDHIYKENNILYPCAQNMLTKKELTSLALQCGKIKINL